jgi:hypothetical protein
MTAALALVSLLELAAANAALDKCRQLDREFDTKAMVTPCQVAADDGTLAAPERVEALRLLAFAHVVNGDEALAEPAFLKMLVFSPTAELPADAGPRFKEVFARAKARFEADGALTVTFTAPARDATSPVPLQLDIIDKLGRVVAARVKTTASDGGVAEDRLARSELAPGQLRFSGVLPEPLVKDSAAPGERTLKFDVTLEGWDGEALAVPTPVQGEIGRTPGAAAEGGEVPWLWIGVGSAAVVGAAAITGGVLGWCFVAGPCRTQDAWVRVQVQEAD